MGKGYIEVRARGINKGVIVDHVVSLLHSHCGGLDFVLCIGDDTADEHMFSALHERFGSAGTFGPTTSSAGPSIFTTVVGRKPSAAQYYLNDPDEVLELCQSLRLHSTRANRNRSMGDLQRLHSERPWMARLGGRPADPRGGLDWSRLRQPAYYINEASGI